MTAKQPASAGKTLPRWTTPLCDVPNSGPPEAIYAALSAGREGNWFTIEDRIILFSSRLRKLGIIDKQRENQLFDRLIELNDAAREAAQRAVPDVTI
jgi:hypothetical protein